MAENIGITIEGFAETSRQLDRLLASNPDMEKKVRKIVRTVLMDARNRLSAQAVAGLQMQSDPREAYRAVRSSVYKQLIGGQLNILNRRKAGERGQLPPVVHRLETELNSKGNHRGGNRAPRSRRTEDLLTYVGADRGFVLRFLNSGTGEREASSRGGRIHGKRGKITARDWFGKAAGVSLEQAAADLSDHIEGLIIEEFGQNN